MDSGHAFILWWKQKTTTLLIGELQSNLASACREKYYLCSSFDFLACLVVSATSVIGALLSNSCRCDFDLFFSSTHAKAVRLSGGRRIQASPLSRAQMMFLCPRKSIFDTEFRLAAHAERGGEGPERGSEGARERGMSSLISLGWGELYCLF